MRQIRSLIIVLHHLHLDQLDTVLKELQRTCTFDYDNRVMIIDSPSTKETREYLSKIDWADVLLTSNEYWQRSCWNQGFRRLHAKYYITCHTDIRKMTPGWREVMLNYLDNHPEVGAMVAYVSNEHPGELPYVGTCLTAYRRTCLEEVGIFDEEFDPLFNYEDEDWSARARAKGWKLVMLGPDEGTAIDHIWGEAGNYISWDGILLSERKKKQVKREDIEYLPKTPKETNLVRPEEMQVCHGILIQKYNQAQLDKKIQEWLSQIPKDKCPELMKYMARWKEK